MKDLIFTVMPKAKKAFKSIIPPKASLLFHWKSLRRQVRLKGQVIELDEATADAYFQTRARGSQIGAWASQQSRPLEGAFALEKRVAELTLKFGLGRIERPPYWKGYRVVPMHFEFWRDKPFRLHDRLVLERTAQGDWASVNLYP